jgi:uncharacterized protein YcsI (UPF0317 family)
LAPGYLQGNLVILPEDVADEFEGFCRANSRSLPFIERSQAGKPFLSCGTDFDVRTDLPRYRVWRQGKPAECRTDIVELWNNESVAFVLGCWFANEDALAQAGIRLRHLELGIQGSLFRTSICANPFGRFSGPVVASMRPFATKDVSRVAEITGGNTLAHGAPLHIGDANLLGIGDINAPDYGECIAPLADETAVFWACGLTGQEALAKAGLPIFITHEPGHMAVTDIRAAPPASA